MLRIAFRSIACRNARTLHNASVQRNHLLARERTDVMSVSGALKLPRSACLSTSSESHDKMYMVFTCGNCETRAVKGFAKSSYESGVVLVQCPGCSKRHVIADHLGWFGSEKNIEEILAAKGENVTRLTDVDIEGTDGLSLKEIVGKGGTVDKKDVPS